MRFAAMNFHYVRHTLLSFLDDAVACGFRDVELWAASPHFNIDDINFSMVRHLRRELVARELTLCCITPEQCVYPISLSIQDKTMRRRSMEYFKRTIDIASALSCPMVLVTPGYGYFDRPHDEAWKLCTESLSELASYAEDAGVILPLECLLSTTSNVLNRCDELAKMLQQINSPTLVSVIDFNQMADTGESVKDYCNALGDSLRHVHFIDGMPNGHLALGDGGLPLDRYVQELKDAGYDGISSLEICDRRYYHEPRKALERCVAWLRTRGLMSL